MPFVGSVLRTSWEFPRAERAPHPRLRYNFLVTPSKRIVLRRTPLVGTVATAALFFTVACGGSPASAPAATSAPGAQSQPKAPSLTLIEPISGASAGHIDTFSWSAVEGADGYRLNLTAATDGRVVWQSPVVTTTETRLPPTVALEPESYFWQVTALRGTTEIVASAPSRFAVTP